MASYRTMSLPALRDWMEGFDDIHIDLGTGDGTYAVHMARINPDMAVIGIDTCLDNLTKTAHRGLPNLRFVSCDATDTPAWMHRTATSASINFPFGSLLRAVADDDAGVRCRLFAVAKPGARVEIRVNGSAAEELGIPLDVIRERLRRMQANVSVTVEPNVAFRRFPSEWAKRLAYGRRSEVVVATAHIRL